MLYYSIFEQLFKFFPRYRSENPQEICSKTIPFSESRIR